MNDRWHELIQVSVVGSDGNKLPVKECKINRDPFDYTTRVMVVLDFDAVRLDEYTRDLSMAPSLDAVVSGWAKESTQCNE